MDRLCESKSGATGHRIAWLAVVAAFVVVDYYWLRQAEGLEPDHAVSSREHVQALQRYGAEAKAGDAQAQHALGMAYETGQGVDQDYAKAAEYYRLAADQGHGPALVALGTLYFRGLGVPRDYVEAGRWLRPAAEQGHPAAQWRLCRIYARGLGVDKDHAEAKAWCREAAAAGHVWAQEELGRLYDDGFPPDYAQALEWYRRASDQGSAVARLRMYFIYSQGRRGVRRDPVKALAYLDYAQIGRLPDRESFFVTTVGNAPDGAAEQGMRNWVTAKMSKEEIAEAQELLRQWTGGKASSDDPVIEYAHPD